MTIDKKTYRLSILSCIHHVLVLALALSLPSRRKCRKKSINKLNIKKKKKQILKYKRQYNLKGIHTYMDHDMEEKC